MSHFIEYFIIHSYMIDYLTSRRPLSYVGSEYVIFQFLLGEVIKHGMKVNSYHLIEQLTLFIGCFVSVGIPITLNGMYLPQWRHLVSVQSILPEIKVKLFCFD